MTMKRLIARALRRLGWLRYDLLAYPVAQHPGKNVVPPGELWVVIDTGVKRWACMSCPGGCGVQICPLMVMVVRCLVAVSLLKAGVCSSPRGSVMLRLWMR